MSQIVWWEIETREPEVFQEFHSAMWGWTFEPAFVDTELDADYWIIKVDGQSIGGLQRSRPRRRRMRAPGCTWRSTTWRRLRDVQLAAVGGTHPHRVGRR